PARVGTVIGAARQLDFFLVGEAGADKVGDAFALVLVVDALDPNDVPAFGGELEASGRLTQEDVIDGPFGLRPGGSGAGEQSGEDKGEDGRSGHTYGFLEESLG